MYQDDLLCIGRNDFPSGFIIDFLQVISSFFEAYFNIGVGGTSLSNEFTQKVVVTLTILEETSGHKKSALPQDKGQLWGGGGNVSCPIGQSLKERTQYSGLHLMR